VIRDGGGEEGQHVMTKPLSQDLRSRLIAAIDGGLSRRQAAARFGIATSTAVKWAQRWRNERHPEAPSAGRGQAFGPDRGARRGDPRPRRPQGRHPASGDRRASGGAARRTVRGEHDLALPRAPRPDPQTKRRAAAAAWRLFRNGEETDKRIRAVLDEPPPAGFARWIGPLIAEALGDVGVQYVWRSLRKQKIDLGGRKSWCESKDPEFASKAADVVGLYMAPPRNAVVLCIDEKPSIQALERPQGYLKLPNGRALTGHSHDDKRHGTTR
jgi:hypothetical protein